MIVFEDKNIKLLIDTLKSFKGTFNGVENINGLDAILYEIDRKIAVRNFNTRHPIVRFVTHTFSFINTKDAAYFNDLDIYVKGKLKPTENIAKKFLMVDLDIRKLKGYVNMDVVYE